MQDQFRVLLCDSFLLKLSLEIDSLSAFALFAQEKSRQTSFFDSSVEQKNYHSILLALTIELRLDPSLCLLLASSKN